MLRKRIHREADNKVGAWRRAAVWGSRGPLSRLHSLVVAHWPNRRRHVRWSCLGKGLRGQPHNCWRRTELPARLFFSRHNHPGFWLCVGGGPPLPSWWLEEAAVVAVTLLPAFTQPFTFLQFEARGLRILWGVEKWAWQCFLVCGTFLLF